MKKKELINNYRVQLTFAGKEFYGNAELPQQAKHNASSKALEILSAGWALTGPEEAAATETSEAATPTSAASGSGRGYEKNVNMALNEIAMRMGCELKWTLVSETGPAHYKVDNGLDWRWYFHVLFQKFTGKLTMRIGRLGNFITYGAGHSKKIAK